VGDRLLQRGGRGGRGGGLEGVGRMMPEDAA